MRGDLAAADAFEVLAGHLGRHLLGYVLQNRVGLALGLAAGPTLAAGDNRTMASALPATTGIDFLATGSY